jgi:hypothetical protein
MRVPSTYTRTHRPRGPATTHAPFTPPQNRGRFRASSELGPGLWFHTAKEPAPAPKNRFNSGPTLELG